MGRNSSRSGESEDGDAGSAGDATAAGPSTSSPSHSASIREQFGLDGSSTFQHSELTGGDSPGPSVRGQAGRPQYEEYYGVEISAPGEVDRLQRLEESNTLQQVREWADEGMPVAAMGEIPQMDAFRERKGTPVPWDVEQRNEASRRRNTSAVQRAKRGSPAGRTDTPESVREVLSSPGRSLDASIQRAMEERMGDSLGDVRIHTGPNAAKACEDIDARAFTVGNHVAFNHGEYDPESPEGQHVLAHELAHVRQQTGGAVSLLPKDDVDLEIDPDRALEHEAEETAQRVMEGGELGIQRMGTTEIHLQRWKNQPRDEAGRFDFKDEREYSDKKYTITNRPPYAIDQVETVWQRAKRESPDGTVRDPNDPSITLTWDRSRSRNRQWHMGHKEGREYRYLLEYYVRGEISEREFVREYQNPDHYRPEAPTKNASRKHEGEGEFWERTWGRVE